MTMRMLLLLLLLLVLLLRPKLVLYILAAAAVAARQGCPLRAFVVVVAVVVVQCSAVLVIVVVVLVSALALTGALAAAASLVALTAPFAGFLLLGGASKCVASFFDDLGSSGGSLHSSRSSRGCILCIRASPLEFISCCRRTRTRGVTAFSCLRSPWWGRRLRMVRGIRRCLRAMRVARFWVCSCIARGCVAVVVMVIVLLPGAGGGSRPLMLLLISVRTRRGLLMLLLLLLLCWGWRWWCNSPLSFVNNFLISLLKLLERHSVTSFVGMVDEAEIAIRLLQRRSGARDVNSQSCIGTVELHRVKSFSEGAEGGAEGLLQIFPTTRQGTQFVLGCCRCILRYLRRVGRQDVPKCCYLLASRTVGLCRKAELFRQSQSHDVSPSLDSQQAHGRW
mmetsp:Transcript_71796/g.156328  ORF Transcript_71796/g.156328 Transcript_71796/m.156328 type:complete len:393 (+) Transcript_71796:469-1647(+)